jgi:hypothetical protein
MWIHPTNAGRENLYPIVLDNASKKTTQLNAIELRLAARPSLPLAGAVAVSMHHHTPLTSNSGTDGLVLVAH